MTHPVFSLLTAMLLSLGMAAAENRAPSRRVRAAVRMFLLCILATVGGGWLMRLIHG